MSDSTGLPAGSALPPSLEEPMLLDDAPAWPRHIGTLSIIWVVIGGCCAGCMLALAVASPSLIGMIPDEAQRAKALREQPPQAPLALVSLGASFLMAFLLLFAGILTLRRQALGRTLHMVWAGLTLVLIAIGLWDGFRHMPALEKWVQENPNVPAAKFMSGPAMMIQMLIYTAIRLVWPVFCLIWFGLVKRTPETMTGHAASAGGRQG